MSTDFEFAQRMLRSRKPDRYWCTAPRDGSGPASYWWDETPVTREEYNAYSGKPNCADPAAVDKWLVRLK
jgi:hypothetical protein